MIDISPLTIVLFLFAAGLSLYAANRYFTASRRDSRRRNQARPWRN